MSAYCLWDVRDVRDQAAMADYVARVTDTVTAFGGEYVVVGGPWQIMEGEWHPAHPVLIRFPSLDRAHEWYSSEAYAPLRALRLGATTCDAVFFDGVEPQHAASVAADSPLAGVVFDLYRDVHKGLRSGLFRAVEEAGRIDPQDDAALVDSHARLEALLDLLDVHAEHEDEFLGPVIERHLPVLAARLQREHAALDEAAAELRRQVTSVREMPPADRRLGQHRLYLTLSEFVGAYLQHQTTEEAVILPALNRAVPVDELMEANAALIAAITPDDMVAYMRLIVPAVNPLDLVELYVGMRAGAPTDAFAALLGYARDGLAPEAYARLTSGLATV